MRTLSAYWKCQLIGWGFYHLAGFMLMLSGPRFGDARIVSAILGSFFGYLISIMTAHWLYLVIRRLGIPSKKINTQIRYILVLTSFFSVIKIILLFLPVILFNLPIALGRNSSWSGTYILGFFIFSSFLIWNLIFFGYHFAQRVIREERQKIDKERQLWAMEARMLRSQMNPHFIFESTRILHDFMGKKEKQLAIHYLTTFSKLIRILLQNGEKSFVSLHTELETCRYYTELEEMRMYNRLRSGFAVDKTIDQYSIKIPALSIQPFIEKAIYYRLRPAEEGKLSVTITRNDDNIVCTISDSGIGRKAYLQEKNSEKNGLEEINLTQRKGITDTRWFKENASLEVVDKIYENGNPAGTTIQLTFNVYGNDTNSLD
jgi:sensor histidine kinase YesM